jgi:hypothetical protein
MAEASEPKSTEAPLDCATFNAEVVDLVYDEPLPAERRLQLDDHAEGCAQCRGLFEDLKEARAFGAHLQGMSPPAELDERIRALTRLQTSPRWALRLQPLGWAAAASLLLAFGYVLGMASGTATPRPLAGFTARLRPNDMTLKSATPDAPLYISLDQSQPYPATASTFTAALLSSCPRLDLAEDYFARGQHVVAEAIIAELRAKLDSGERRDGLFITNEGYRQRLSRLEKRLELARGEGAKPDAH